MSFDQQLADEMHRANTFANEMKAAMKKLGGVVDEKWNDDELIAQFRETVSATVNAGRQSPREVTFRSPNGDTQKIQAGPIDINATERQVSITFSQETREFETTNVPGRLMFALVHELKRPAGEAEMIAAMAERGWNHAHGAVSPELSKLIKKGDLIGEGSRPVRYRVPGKLKVKIDGKAVPGFYSEQKV